MKYLSVFAGVVGAFVLWIVPDGAAAQVISTPYWCGSYYSSVPCAYDGSYNYNTNYNYGYSYTYPAYSYSNYTYAYPAYPSYPVYPTYAVAPTHPTDHHRHPTNNYGYTSPVPTCTIAATNSGNLQYGYGGYAQATLSWSSTNATSAYISPSIGSVSTYGSIAVYPQGNYTYTMTVYGPGGSNTCQTSYYQPQQYYYQPQYYYTYPSHSYPYSW